MPRALGLGALLFGFWLILSGHFTPDLIAFGAGSAALAAFVSHRMSRVDGEELHLHVGGRFWTYLPWLLKEVFLANVHVARLILHPRLPISPVLVHYRGSQRTDLGKALYANSITLTPGTITIGVRGNDFHIHSLTWVDVDGREEDEMDRRCTWVEQGGRA